MTAPTTAIDRRRFLSGLSAGALAAALPAAVPTEAGAFEAVTGFRRGVAEAASRHEVLAAFYRNRGFEGIWAGGAERDVRRRNALLTAMAEASAHGMGRLRHDPQALVRTLTGARTPHEQGQAEVAMSAAFLRLSHDLGAGMLLPSSVVPAIKREPMAPDPLALITVFPEEEPVAFLAGLAPASAEYGRLLSAKLRLQDAVATGGWGEPAPSLRLDPGQSGPDVGRLRNRLVAMGHMEPTPSDSYDDALIEGVAAAQAAHGLVRDGIAGEATLAELNAPPEARLRSVLVALERERWNAAPRGTRHVWVNLVDFHAQIVDDDRVTFRTRSVIGSHESDRETPEFSDLMEFLVINPSWSVPRSIVVNEYLPQMRGNRNAAGHLDLIDAAGRTVSRGSVNFGAYSASSFPFAMRQPPGPRNALGVVKFMFPNPWNIYLHDTPSKDLFDRDVRAFSHGCIRLADPRDFAFHLLARQTLDPQGFFESRLGTGSETRVDLELPVPVHLDYRTAFTGARGDLRFRRDVYGRDARIWDGLAAEGVEATAVEA